MARKVKAKIDTKAVEAAATALLKTMGAVGLTAMIVLPKGEVALLHFGDGLVTGRQRLAMETIVELVRIMQGGPGEVLVDEVGPNDGKQVTVQ